jgi:hypothetical protein
MIKSPGYQTWTGNKEHLMKRYYKFIIIAAMLSVLMGACGLPVQVVSQQQPAAAATAAPQSQPVAAQDNSSDDLLATLSVLETRLASSSNQAKSVAKDGDATAVPSNTPEPSATPQPNTVSQVVNTATAVPTNVPTATPIPAGQSTQPPVVYITPLYPYQPYPYQPYGRPNYYYGYQQYNGYQYPYQYNQTQSQYQYPNYYNVPCNRATFIADVSVPDGANFSAGNTFTKTWRLRNDGSCKWTTGYSLIFDHGYSLGGNSVSMPAEVAPGGVIDLSVNLTAPNDNGVYQGYWMLQDASGSRFGIGQNATVAFWVKITVGPYYYYNYNNYNYYNYDPNYYHRPDYYPYGGGSCQVVSVSPSISVDRNSPFDIKWTVKNTSNTTWDNAAVDYIYLGGTQMYKHSAYDLNSDIGAGDTGEIIVDAIAPSSPGTYSMTWGVVNGSTRLCTMVASVRVK